MKKIKLLFLALCVFPLIQSQEKIEGLGMFKINTYTVSDLYNLLEERKIPKILNDNVDTYFNYTFGKNKDKQVCFIAILDTIKTGFLNHCPNSQRFNLRNFELAGMKVDLWLDFYNDTLYEIMCSDFSSNFITLIEQKYGKGKDKKVENKHTYLYWYNEEIKAEYKVTKYKNKNLGYDYLFKVSNETIDEIQKKCNEEHLEKIKAKQLNEL